jgi:branched-chain amino acid transport system substrate-binding protein
MKQMRMRAGALLVLTALVGAACGPRSSDRGAAGTSVVSANQPQNPGVSTEAGPQPDVGVAPDGVQSLAPAGGSAASGSGATAGTAAGTSQGSKAPKTAAGAASRSAVAGPVTGSGGGAPQAGTPASGPGGGPAAPGGVAPQSPAGNGGATDVGVTADRIRIGGILAESGALGAIMGPQRVGYDAWIKAYNAKGGVNGRRIEVVWGDTQGNASKHAEVARELIDSEKVFALTVGDPLSAGGGGSIIQQRGVPVIGGDSAHPVWFQNPMYYPLGNQFNGVVAMAAHSVTNVGMKKLAVMWFNAQTAIAGCQAGIEEIKKRGGEVVYSANVPLGTPDFSTYVNQAKQAGAEGIVNCFDLSQYVTLLKAEERQGWKPYNGGISAAADERLLTAASPELLDGTDINFPMPAWSDSTSAFSRLYLDVLQRTQGSKAVKSNISMRGMMAAMLLTTALEQVGPTVTRKAVIDWLNHQTRASLVKVNPLFEWLPPDTSYVPGANGAHPESLCSVEYRIHGGGFVRSTPDWFCLGGASGQAASAPQRRAGVPASRPARAGWLAAF